MDVKITTTGCIAAPPKFGKSWWGAKAVSELDGFILDIARVERIGPPPMTKNGIAVEYKSVGDGFKNVGDAYQAASTVGIDIDNNYKFIRNWTEFEAAIEAAKFYRDNISEKKNKRIWIIVDDTKNWRDQCLQHVLQKMNRTQPSREAYETVNSMLNGAISDLESNFNVLFVCQSKEEYENNEKTGRWTGNYYPPNLVHSTSFNIYYDAKKDEETGVEMPYMRIDALRNAWRFGKTSRPTEIVFDDVDKMSFAGLLETLHVDKSTW